MEIKIAKRNNLFLLRTMKIFISNQKYLATLGITRDQAMQCQPFNARIFLSFLILSLPVISHGGYLFCVANSSKEYTESVYMTTAFICIATDFLAFTWNTKDFFDFVDGWEKCVEQS